MKAYPAYKDSGVEWIGKIPLNWNALPLKHAAIINRQTLTMQTDANYEFQYIDIGNVNHKGIINPPELIRFSEAPSRARRIIKKNDTIISTVRTYLKAVAFINSEEKNLVSSTGFATLTPISKFAPKFLYYMVSSQGFVDIVTANSVGVSYPAITSTELARIHVWLPPLPEQRAIADFLDRKTAQIDTLIDKKQRQIELLQEQRIAIINQAVTKGLNPDVPMKDSGVEWLGEIPGHWEVKKLKWLANVALSNIDKKTKDDEPEVELCNYTDVYYYEHISQSIDFMRASASRNQIKQLSLQAGDVLITKDSETPDDIAVPAYVPETLPGVVCGYHLSHLRSYAKEMRGKYLFRSFQANDINDQFQFSAKGITRFGISKYIIENALFLQPPLHEQRAIADFLDHRTAIIDHNVTLTNKEINLLQEYRTALISATVTGKIDVRAEGS